MRSTRFLLIMLLITSSCAFAAGAWISSAWKSEWLRVDWFTRIEPRSALASAIAHSADTRNDELIVEPDDGMTSVGDLIRNASSSVDLVMYEFDDPNIEEALGDAEKRGVHVQVLLNKGYYGAPAKTNPNEAAYEYLTTHHVPVQWTSASFALTHEKSLIVDNTKAFIMTFNLDQADYIRSRDFGIIDDDAKDVQAITATFDADWHGNPSTESFGDDLVWSPNAEQDVLSTIQGAHSSLDIYNEELADDDVVQALVAARKRGVSVRLLMTYSSLWKKELTQLSSAGVQVRTYANTKKSPLYIHAKAIIIDDGYIFIGSQNFSPTSLTKSRELGLLISNIPIAHSLEHTFENDWSNPAADTFHSEPS